MQVRNVLFDFMDTLVQESSQYSLDACLVSLLNRLECNRISIPIEDFRKAYDSVYKEIYRERSKSLRETTYDIVVSRVLGRCGYSLEPTNDVVREAVEAFMDCWIKARTMEKGVPVILRKLEEKFALGIISNLQYSPAVTMSLQRFGIATLFKAVVVSADVGWRKPSPRIFWEALEIMAISANQTVYVGDELDHDIEGAANVGLHTVLLKRPSTNMTASKRKPDLTIVRWTQLIDALETLERH